MSALPAGLGSDPNVLPGFVEEVTTLGAPGREVDVHHVRAGLPVGRAPAVVLLHGFPATWFG